MDRSTKIEVPCSGCSIDPCYHWPYCTELLSLRAENQRLTLDNQRLTEMWDTDRESLTAENTQLRLALSRSDNDEMQLLRAENKRLRAWARKIEEEAREHLREIERLRARLDAAERLIEFVRAREIGTAGGVGAAFEAYDALC